MASSQAPWEKWFEGKTFTTQWGDPFFESWTRLLARFRERPIDILEVGSWEGRSTVFFLEYLPKSKIVCVDSFEGGKEHIPEYYELEDLEDRFDANTAPYGARLEKIRSRSLPALDKLNLAGRKFEMIYIDGSHQRDDVLMDSILCWRMLKEGGVLLWDDYLWQVEWPAAERPQQAIDTMLALHKGEYVQLLSGFQLAITKTAAATRSLA